MPKGIPINTQAESILSNVKIKIASLPEEENHERIKRLAKKILRTMENNRRGEPADNEDLFTDNSFEQDLAI